MEQNALLNAVLRHQVYMEGLKEGQGVDMLPAALVCEREIRRILVTLDVTDLGDLTRKKLLQLASQIASVVRGFASSAMEAFRKWLLEYLVIDRAFIPVFVEDESRTVPVGTMPGADLLYSRGLNAILPAGGVTSMALMAGTVVSVAEQAKRLVLAAAVNRDSVASLRAALVGTTGNGFRDGSVHKSLLALMNTKRTIFQQFINMVQDAAYALFSDRYMWVSVLDSRTTEICRTRNGRVYERRQGPLPPAHFNCRSTTVPLIIRQPIPNLPRTWYEWIRGQNDNFVSDILPERLAMALRSGKARASDFPGLSRVAPLTLDQYETKKRLISSGER